MANCLRQFAACDSDVVICSEILVISQEMSCPGTMHSTTKIQSHTSTCHNISNSLIPMPDTDASVSLQLYAHVGTSCYASERRSYFLS